MVALELAQRMHADGIAVTTACTPNTPLSDKLLASGLDVLPVQRRNKYISPITVRTLRRALASGRYSAVLVEQLNELWQVVPALRGHDNVRLVGISHTLVGVAKRDWFHERLYGRVNHLVALTEIHRRNLIERLPVHESNLVVIPNAVDLRRFHPSKRNEDLRREFLRAPDELLIGVVSRIDKGKGLLEVVEAAEALHGQGIPFRLIIAGRETIGEEGMHQVLLDEIQKRGLSERVFLIGHRPGIESVMASLDLLLMPSPGETFGRVLIEAMASGTPVIATAAGGVPDIIHDGEDGLLVPARDAARLAESVVRCARDPQLRRRLSAGGLAAAHGRYDQRKLDRQLFELLGLFAH
jgi:glycosyltransferase involved in cell wall biosynthesis